jgi:beta-N-acetylhexosaminidase
MSPDERIAQLIVPGLNGVFTSVDSGEFQRLARLAGESRVGGFHVFGGSEPLPAVLLNPSYGSGGSRATKADALGAAALINRLQREAAVPLLFAADFEGGAVYIVDGATRLPRAMALAAARDPALVERAGTVAAREGRALGVHVDFYPVVDVNNNPRNPIINLRLS